MSYSLIDVRYSPNTISEISTSTLLASILVAPMDSLATPDISINSDKPVGNIHLGDEEC
jgi:hypothetical protein